MVDWARSSEDRVTIPKNILSSGKPGESCKTHYQHTSCAQQQPTERKKGTVAVEEGTLHVHFHHFASHCEHDNIQQVSL